MRLKFIREYFGNTQNEIANFLNINRENYVAFENRKRPIPLKYLFNLCNYYQINIDYMVNLTSKQTNVVCNTEIDLNLVGNNIKIVRNNAKLSQRNFAKELKISNGTLSNYENGKYLLLTQTALTLCSKYNVSLDWLLGREKNYMLQK